MAGNKDFKENPWQNSGAEFYCAVYVKGGAALKTVPPAGIFLNRKKLSARGRSAAQAVIYGAA